MPLHNSHGRSSARPAAPLKPRSAVAFAAGLVWGKQRGLSDGQVYPLECHLLDTAAAAALLVTDFLTNSQRQVLADTGLSQRDASTLAGILAAWHDIGKTVPGFQVMNESSFSALTGGPVVDVPPPARVTHANAGFAHLVDRFVEDGTYAANRRTAFRLAQVVGGHHGVFPDAEAMTAHGLGSAVWGPRLEGVVPSERGRWKATRTAILDRVERVLVGDRWSAAGLSKLPVPAAALLTGLVVTADWLMSQVWVIEAALDWLPDDPAAMDENVLAGHYAQAHGRARLALDESGLAGPLLQRRPFSVHFPGFAPRGPQVTAAETLPDLVTGPGIVVVMAPPGDGKTEAALHGASVFGEKSGATGVFMVLPTMATTDAMYTRVRDFMATAFTEPTRLSLMHSLASLNEEYVATERRGVGAPPAPDGEAPAQEIATDCDAGEGGGLAEVTAWMRGSKRTVLAPNSVSTIDQLLTLAIRGRWQPLRLLGITRKVVVVDEAHAYDAYMQALLRRALTWLAASGVPVILLSATLSGRLARSLVDAYMAGVGAPPLTEDQVPPYPGWVHFDAGTRAVNSGPVPVTNRSTTVRLRLCPYDGAGKYDTSGLVDAVITAVGPVTRGEADGNILVVCNTVGEAVAVYDALVEITRTHGSTEVRLMHARFPVKDRVRQAREVNRLYGKQSRTAADGEGAARPRRSILVATQIVEQSLDLDMDHVVSDLTTIAMLLQRAGRGHRHLTYRPTPDTDPAPVERPPLFGEPTLTVLVPTSADGETVADRDARPYDQVLLERTARVLRAHREAHPVGIRVPEDVQNLVDAVFGDEFTADLDDPQLKDVARNAHVRESKQQTAANLATIPPPAGVENLYSLTSSEDADGNFARFSARYELNTVTVLPVWEDGRGVWLDRAHTIPLPAAGKPSRAHVRLVVEHSITVPAPNAGKATGKGWDAAVRAEQERLRPPSWADHTQLSGIYLVRFEPLIALHGSRAEISNKVAFFLDEERGLTTIYNQAGAQ